MNAVNETVVVLKCPQGHLWQLSLAATVHAATETVAGGPAACCPTCGQPGASEPVDLALQSATERRELPPEVPGYELLEVIGRGGMAVVYKARQLRPQRIVALKILHHPTNGDDSWVQRFRAEAEAAAHLEHPHIVRMYEVGEVGKLSYLALEYIDGRNLAEYSQGEPQAARWSAELIATLARAMHYAHERGIVHRDLKPGNILLARADEAGLEPRITDFGLAKRLDQDGLQTRTGEVLGTPVYMAPEQATGVTRSIGPACDIHALGLILYELLTGRRPYQGADVMETLRLVAAEDPIPPRRLNATIPRDLETICLKCLEKRPRQRYATAAELAFELQRFLNNETIRTRPAGPLEKSYKWSRRNPATALALAISILLPLLIAAGFFIHSRRVAEELAHTEQQRNRAEANLQQTQEAIDRLLTEINAGRLATLPRSAPVRRELLEWAIGLCRELHVQNPDNDRLRFQSARAIRQTADLERMLGRFKAAQENYQLALHELSELNDTRPNEPKVLRELAAAHNNAGLLEEQLARTVEAERAYRGALEYWSQLAKLKELPPDDQQSHGATFSNLGQLLAQLGQTTEAQQCFERAIRLLNQDFEPSLALATARVNLGILLMSGGHFDSAGGHFMGAKVDLRFLQEQQPDDSEAQAGLAVVENNLAALMLARKEARSAELAYGRAVELLTPLVRDFPTTLAYREQLATTQLNLALLLSEEKREDEAEPLIEQSRKTFAQLAQEQPDSPQFRQGLTKSLQQLAAHLAQQGQQTEAEQTLLEAIKLQQSLAQHFPQRSEVFSQLGLLQHAAAKLLLVRKAHADSQKYFEQAIESQQKALEPNSAALTYRLRLRDHLRGFSGYWIAQGEPAAAARVIDRLTALFPDQADQQFESAQLLAQCLPLAATVKGQEKINGQTAEAYCRQRLLELLKKAIQEGSLDAKKIEQSPAFSPLKNDPQFQQLLQTAH